MGPSEALFIAQLVVLLLVGRLLGEAMQRIGQPAVMGQLLAGVLLGPSVFGVAWPEAQHALFPAGREQKAMLEAVSDLGILLLLLLTGMETDLKLVRRARRAAVSVSVAGIALPFVLGVTLGQLLPESVLPRPDQRLITSLFLGTALSVASVKIVATVVREMKFIRRKVGMTRSPPPSSTTRSAGRSSRSPPAWPCTVSSMRRSSFKACLEPASSCWSVSRWAAALCSA
jgi:Kef-type K+ transport system membrane component KefB